MVLNNESIDAFGNYDVSEANEPHVVDTDRAKEEVGLENVFCSLSNDVAVHFQDCLGQSTTFEFPVNIYIYFYIYLHVGLV